MIISWKISLNEWAHDKGVTTFNEPIVRQSSLSAANILGAYMRYVRALILKLGERARKKVHRPRHLMKIDHIFIQQPIYFQWPMQS